MSSEEGTLARLKSGASTASSGVGKSFGRFMNSGAKMFASATSTTFQTQNDDVHSYRTLSTEFPSTINMFACVLPVPTLAPARIQHQLVTSRGPLDTLMGRMRRSSSTPGAGADAGAGSGSSPRLVTSAATAAASSHADNSTTSPSTANPPLSQPPSAATPDAGKEAGNSSLQNRLSLLYKVPDVASIGRAVTAGVQERGKRIISEGAALIQRASSSSWKVSSHSKEEQEEALAMQKASREDILDKIPNLVAELSQIEGNDVKVSKAAAITLQLISCNEDKWEVDTRVVIMGAGAIPVLIDLLGMPIAIEHAASTLQCLLGTADPAHPCKDAVFVFGGVEVMADLVGLESTASEEAKSHVVACLLNLMHSSNSRKDALIEIPGLVDSVIAQLEGEVLLARRAAVTFIRNLTVGSQDRKDRVVAAGAIPKLAAVIKLPERKVHTAVAQRYLVVRVQGAVTLQSLAHERPDSVKMMVAEDGLLETLREVLRLCAKGSGTFAKFTRALPLPAGIESKDIKAIEALCSTLKCALGRDAPDGSEPATPSRIARQLSDAAKRVAGTVADTAKAAADSAKAAAADYRSSGSSSNSRGGTGAFERAAAAAAAETAEVSEMNGVEFTVPFGDFLNDGTAGNMSTAINVIAPPEETPLRPRRSWLPFGKTAAEKAAEEEAAAAIAAAKAAKTPKFTGPMPVLDHNDPQEKILRRVTEQTLRKEFRSSGGECTPTQIAERFKDQLNDPTDVIDRIARPMAVQEPDGSMVVKLVLRVEFGGRVSQQATPRPLSAEVRANALPLPLPSPARPPSAPISDDAIVMKKKKKKKKKAKVAIMIGDEAEADAALAAATALLAAVPAASAAAALKMAAENADAPEMSPESRHSALSSASEKIKHFYANAAPSSSVPRAQAAAVLASTPLRRTSSSSSSSSSSLSPGEDDEAAVQAKNERKAKLQASSERIKEFYAKHMPDKYAEKFGEPLPLQVDGEADAPAAAMTPAPAAKLVQEAALDDSGFASPATDAIGKPVPISKNLLGPAASSTPAGMGVPDTAVGVGAPDAPAF